MKQLSQFVVGLFMLVSFLVPQVFAQDDMPGIASTNMKHYLYAKQVLEQHYPDFLKAFQVLQEEIKLSILPTNEHNLKPSCILCRLLTIWPIWILLILGTKNPATKLCNIKCWCPSLICICRPLTRVTPLFFMFSTTHLC